MPDMDFNAILNVLWIPLVVVGFGLAALLAFIVTPKAARVPVEVLTLLGCVAGLVVAWNSLDMRLEAAGMRLDPLSVSVSILILINAILVILVSIPYCQARGDEDGEYLMLILFSAAGMILMALSVDLLMVFVSLEMLSIPLYILAASRRDRRESVEAGLKYLILGSFGSGLFLYGMALLYGAAGSTRFDAILAILQDAGGVSPLAALGCLLLLAAVAFKLSAVPFHMWAPDVYQGAPTPIAALIATAAKAAILVPFARFAGSLLGEFATQASQVILVLSVLSMTIGNLLALVQEDAKRMLAYSSVAHAGYVLMAFSLPAGVAADAAIFYIIAYSFMNITAFAVVSVLETRGVPVTIRSLRGFGRRNPWLSVAFVISMLALMGIPPTAGFLGKFLLFKAVVDAEMFTLALIAAVNSLVALFYYLRFATAPFKTEEDDSDLAPAATNPAPAVAITLGALATLWLGMLPGGVLQKITEAASTIF